MEVNLDFITHNLELRNGIWYSKGTTGISYPKEANERCYQLEENSFWFRHRNQCIIETVRHFTPDGLVLDVGGGNGYVASGLEKAGVKTVLVEPGPQGVLNAKKRGLSNVICSSLEDIQLNENSLEAAGIFDVLEHIKDDISFLRTIHKYLRPGGILYVTVPAYNFLWSLEDESGGHFRRYTLRSLSKALATAGFETRYSTYLFSFLPLPVFLYRTIPGKLGLNKNPRDFQKHQQAHSENKGILNRFLARILKWELKKITGRKRIPFGGSCLIAAAKINS